MEEAAWFALRLVMGLLAGGAIGLERQWRQKIAGVRTNALIAVGAAGFMAVETLIGTPQDAHIAAQIVTGVGFLGGGVILREGFTVHGLNSAATLWCAAMVGMLAGTGHAAATAEATVAVVATNLALRPLVHRLDAELAARGLAAGRMTVTLDCAVTDAARLRPALLAALHGAGLIPDGVQSAADPSGAVVRLTVRADGAGQAGAIEAALARLAREPGVRSSGWVQERVAPDS